MFYLYQNNKEQMDKRAEFKFRMILGRCHYWGNCFFIVPILTKRPTVYKGDGDWFSIWRCLFE